MLQEILCSTLNKLLIYVYNRISLGVILSLLFSFLDNYFLFSFVQETFSFRLCVTQGLILGVKSHGLVLTTNSLLNGYTHNFGVIYTLAYFTRDTLQERVLRLFWSLHYNVDNIVINLPLQNAIMWGLWSYGGRKMVLDDSLYRTSYKLRNCLEGLRIALIPGCLPTKLNVTQFQYWMTQDS